MLKRPLGRTGLSVSAIGLGTWNIGGQWGHVDEGTAIATIRSAVDAGVTLIDSADAYGDPVGRSEELIGRALGAKRERLVLATKVGNYARRQNHALTYSHPLHVQLCCEASLRRLRTDVIDLYQCHIGGLTDYSIFLEAFDTLKQQGKIRFGGLSTNNLDAIKAFNREGACSLVQLDYSLVNRSAEKDVLPYCQQHGIGVLVRGPLAMGVAAGKYSKEAVFDDQVRSGWNSGAAHEKFVRNVDRIDKLKPLLQIGGRSMAHAALQFVISHPAVSCAIPGAKSPEQARSNAGAGLATLSDAELKQVDEITGDA